METIPPITSMPPKIDFATEKDARSFCETVNESEKCEWCQPLTDNVGAWWVLLDEVTGKYIK